MLKIKIRKIRGEKDKSVQDIIEIIEFPFSEWS